MISESVFLFQDGSRVKRHVSKDGEGLWPPKHDGNGNDESEKIAHSKSEIHTSFNLRKVDIFQ